jgi:predicted nuclease with RNAse H fold
MKWTAGRAVIEDVVCRADDEDVLRVVKRASKTGIDCPFGWPAALVGFRVRSSRESSRLVDQLMDKAPWLECAAHEETMRRSHDAFDAVIAGMTARAAALGQTFPPAGDDLAAATAEGWIVIPNKPMSALL